MARIRSLKPEFFTDEEIAKLPPLYRLAFEGLWCHADKAGRLEDRPLRLKVQILPYDDVDFGDAIRTLAEARFLIRYAGPDGRGYLQVRSFDKHQRPRPDEPESILPAPPPALPSDGDVSAQRLSPEPREPEHEVYNAEQVTNADDAASLGSDGSVSAQCIGKEGKGKEGKGVRLLGAARGSKPANPRGLFEAREASPTVLELPTVGADGSVFRLSEAQVAEWAKLFPTVDVMAEARHALAWLRANPGRRKTVRGMPKFLVGWLTRSTDQNGSRNSAARSTGTAGKGRTGAAAKGKYDGIEVSDE